MLLWGGITYAASAPPSAAAHFPGLPATPPASAFVPARADAPPLVTHLTPTQMQLEKQQIQSLTNPVVATAIRHAINSLPPLTVAPDKIAVASTHADGFTIVESSQNPVSGDPTSTASHNLTLYDAYGGIVYVVTYHDTFHWTGSQVSAAQPYWTYWRAWYEFVNSFEPGSSTVSNWGSESYSQGYANIVLSISFGTIKYNLTGEAYMYANGNWSAGVQE